MRISIRDGGDDTFVDCEMNSEQAAGKSKKVATTKLVDGKGKEV